MECLQSVHVPVALSLKCPVSVGSGHSLLSLDYKNMTMNRVSSFFITTWIWKRLLLDTLVPSWWYSLGRVWSIWVMWSRWSKWVLGGRSWEWHHFQFFCVRISQDINKLHTHSCCPRLTHSQDQVSITQWTAAPWKDNTEQIFPSFHGVCQVAMNTEHRSPVFWSRHQMFHD